MIFDTTIIHSGILMFHFRNFNIPSELYGGRMAVGARDMRLPPNHIIYRNPVLASLTRFSPHAPANLLPRTR